MAQIRFKLTILIFLLIGCICDAQNYRVEYELNYKRDSTKTEISKKTMVLLIKEAMSKFFSKDQFISDSIKASGKIIPSQQLKIDYDFMVIKDNAKKINQKYSIISQDLYKVDEKAPSFNWIISNQTRKIDNYNCQKATLYFSGRKWEAWFSVDIALKDGPYIFGDLPGLIIYMKESRNDYEFKFIGLTKYYSTDLQYLSKKAITVSKEQLRKIYLDYYNDPYREMKSGKTQAVFYDDNGKETNPDYRALTKEEQEYIREVNNPIELSEAIKYPN